MPQYRKDRLENDHYYHIYSRSIAKYVIFNNNVEFSRFREIFELYRHTNFNYQYSKFARLDPFIQNQIINEIKSNDEDLLVEIISFCLMPTHIHFLLKQVSDEGISRFMSKILNCYARFFNIKHKRNGPLWSGRFKSVLVSTDEQLLHLTRYIHLNPTSAGLVNKPEDWLNSSYLDFIDPLNSVLLNKNGLFTISPKTYEKFVLDQKDYQRELSIIKNLIIDDYSG